MECTFLYARSALVTAGVFTARGDKKRDVVRVLEYFPDVDSKSVDAFRAIADVFQQVNDYDLSEEFARNAFALTDPSSENRFSTHWIQAHNFYMAGWNTNLATERAAVTNSEVGDLETANETCQESPQPSKIGSRANIDVQAALMGDASTDNERDLPLPGSAKVEKALQHITSAMMLLPEEWQYDEEWATAVEGIFILKGNVLRFLRRIDDALTAYNESRAVRSDGGALDSETLDGMVNIELFDVDADTWAENAVKPGRYFDIIESWTLAERLKWFNLITEIDFDEGNMAVVALHKCAKRCGERGRQITVGLYEACFKTVARTSSKSAQAKFSLAQFYKFAVDDLRKACDVAKDALDVEYEDDDAERSEDVLNSIWHGFCDNLFELFRQSADPHEKSKLLDTMKLPAIKIATEGDEAAKRFEE